ncbi:MAG TPA: hypothetical protein VJT49_21630 [Amycolatopsis sp.]|uniref:hypothetical protein n=1 Tax=Amycolatopsis sp. TaxID=37632 RepID=UPI002B473132|nr:hypothetical protein [Amycolatopsis sp.]HKS47661.1 hypothetical protein [Amycolatopsis sp.]
MVIEFARFAIHEGAEDVFRAERPAMVAAMRRRFPAGLAAFLIREDDGDWLDVVFWRGRAEAEEAARLIDTVPACAAWFKHIADSGGLRQVEVADAWVGGDFVNAA